MIKNMNSKMTTIKTKPQRTKKQTKPITRTGTESQKWRSHGGLAAGRRRKEKKGKGTGNKQHNWTLAGIAQWIKYSPIN